MKKSYKMLKKYNNKSLNAFKNINLRNKTKPNNPRRGNGFGPVFYNYSQRPQKYGVGNLIKNYEIPVSITAGTSVNETIKINGADFVIQANAFKYMKIIGIGIVQDSVNFENEDGKLYGSIDWGEINTNENLEISDNAKIFKNIGNNFFKFKVPRILARISVRTSGTATEWRYVEPDKFIEPTILYSSNESKYVFPCAYKFKNTTTTDRKVKVIVRVVFRGDVGTTTSSIAKLLVQTEPEFKEEIDNMKRMLEEKQKELDALTKKMKNMQQVAKRNFRKYEKLEYEDKLRNLFPEFNQIKKEEIAQKVLDIWYDDKKFEENRKIFEKKIPRYEENNLDKDCVYGDLIETINAKVEDALKEPISNEELKSRIKPIMMNAVDRYPKIFKDLNMYLNG